MRVSRRVMKKMFSVIVGLSVSIAACVPFSENSAKRTDSIVVAAKPSGNVVVANIVSVKSVPSLDPMTRRIIRSYGSTIRKYSEKYGFDWRLTLAVMKAESNFLDTAESHRGASGLMQIMPSTQEELARVLEIENIAEPRSNIRAGIFYLSRLKRMFKDAEENDRLRLALAAYNAGPGRVFDAQNVARYLNDDPTRWQSVKDALPLLSKRYYTLHGNIWAKRSKPRSGSFGHHRETIAYVEKVMNYYDHYRLVLN